MADTKLVIRVYFVDESFKTFAVAGNVTTRELLEVVKGKIELKSGKTYSLFLRRKDEERCLEEDELPCHLLVKAKHGESVDAEQYFQKAEWDRLKKELEAMQCHFVYKIRVFLKHKQLPTGDPVFIRYHYIQGVYDVINGHYPCSQSDAIELAGLQMQVTFGNHDKKVHLTGFLKDKISRFIPAPLLALRRSVEAWERDVFAEHARLTDLSAMDAMLHYLNHIRRWSFYGSTFWSVLPITHTDSPMPDQVVLAVNSDGIQILETASKEIFASHKFSDIYSWAYKKNAFAFVSGSISKQKFQFATQYGKDISKTLQAYVDILLEEYKATQHPQDNN